ncbi:MAG: hypothetical protein HY820_24920 [Acidobacteria bacterium]|nr:hypothetical protein [Acidobacteriota bacterium]
MDLDHKRFLIHAETGEFIVIDSNLLVFLVVCTVNRIVTFRRITTAAVHWPTSELRPIPSRTEESSVGANRSRESPFGRHLVEHNVVRDITPKDMQAVQRR